MEFVAHPQPGGCMDEEDVDFYMGPTQMSEGEDDGAKEDADWEEDEEGPGGQQGCLTDLSADPQDHTAGAGSLSRKAGHGPCAAAAPTSAPPETACIGGMSSWAGEGGDGNGDGTGGGAEEDPYGEPPPGAAEGQEPHQAHFLAQCMAAEGATCGGQGDGTQAWAAGSCSLPTLASRQEGLQHQQHHHHQHQYQHDHNQQQQHQGHEQLHGPSKGSGWPGKAPSMEDLLRLMSIVSLPVPVSEWLLALGLESYEPLLQAEEVDEIALPLLSDTDLCTIGIADARHRATMLESVTALCGSAPALLDSSPPFPDSARQVDGAILQHHVQARWQQQQQQQAHPPHPAGQQPLLQAQGPEPKQRPPAQAHPQQQQHHHHHQPQQPKPQLQPQQPQQQQRQPQATSTAPAFSGYNTMFSSKQSHAPRITRFFEPAAGGGAGPGPGTGGMAGAGPGPGGPYAGAGAQQAGTGGAGPWAGAPQAAGQQGSRGPGSNQWPQQQPLQQQQPYSGQQPGGKENQGPPGASGPGAQAGQPMFKQQAHTGQGAGQSVMAPFRPPPPPGGPRPGRLLTGVPPWHTLPGTRFVVDYFGQQSLKVKGSNGIWILTHFHADHYKGLTRHFSLGNVLCSPITAQLVSTKLKVPWGKLQVLQLDTPTVVDGVRLTLVDANHCPGAAMVVAELPSGHVVLHTGDCRLTQEMQTHPILQGLKGRPVTLVLDTTYCNPQYCFPTQQDVLQYTLGAVKSDAFNPRALFVFGTYTIGKERLFLEVARALNKKVYMSKEKAQTLSCCNLTPEYAQLVTTNHLETNLHAVPLGKVNLEGLGAILQHYRGRYNTVVGVQPTGWTMERQSKKGGVAPGKRVQKGSIIMYQVPYSEHSSFRELHDFVTWLQPIDILPSVGNDNGQQTARMLELLRGPLPASCLSGAAALGVKPITSFMQQKRKRGEPAAGHAAGGVAAGGGQ